jgi:hypothetical protein
MTVSFRVPIEDPVETKKAAPVASSFATECTPIFCVTGCFIRPRSYLTVSNTQWFAAQCKQNRKRATASALFEVAGPLQRA